MFGVKVTRYRLDSAFVMSKVDPAIRKNLNRQGATVRQIQRRSMRDRKGPSKPGQPPNAHTRYLKDRIFYSYDPSTRSVVVGPELAKVRGADPITSTVPGVLESGGDVRIEEYKRRQNGKWVRVSKRTPAGRERRKRTIHIKARPSAEPALQKSLSSFPDLWKGSVR